MKAVVVDMGNPSRMRVMAVSTGKTARLLWLENHHLREHEGDIWDLLKKILQDHSAMDLPLCWIPGRDQVGAAVLALPPIPRREIAKILPREVGQLTEASQELATAFILGEKIEEKGAFKQEVISTYMPQALLYDSLDRMKALGFAPRWVLPELAGHLQLLGNIKKTIREPLSGTVLFEVDASKVAMTIYRGESWGLERVFTYRHDEDGGVGEEDLSRISVELNRTLQFFKQRFRRANVDRLVIFGSSSKQDQIAEHIRTNHALHVVTAEQVFSSERVDLSVLGETAPEILPSILTALNILPSLTGSSELDLFPAGYVDRDRLRSRIVGLGISYALVTSLLAVATVYLLGVRNEYRQQIHELSRTVSQQEAQNVQLVSTRKKRAFYYQWEHFKLWPKRYTAISTDFIRQLTLMVTPEIGLSEIVVDPRPHGAAFVLKGHISVADSIAAQSIFIHFFDQIKSHPRIISLDSSNVKVNAAREATGKSYTTEALPKKSEVELYFSINGEVEWP